MLIDYDSKLDADGFLLEHYATEEDKAKLSELEKEYGTAQDEYYALGTNPDATADDVNNARSRLLKVYEQWHNHTRETAVHAVSAYTKACVDYSHKYARRTYFSLIREDIKHIMESITATDYIDFLSYLKLNNGYAQKEDVEHFKVQYEKYKADIIEKALHGDESEKILPEQFTNVSINTAQMYLYQRIEAQIYVLTVLKRMFNIDYNHREVRERAREIISELHNIDSSITKSTVPDEITAQVSLLQKTLFKSDVKTIHDTEIVSVDAPNSGQDGFRLYIDTHGDIAVKPIQLSQMDRFICDCTDTLLEDSSNGKAKWDAETICRAMIGADDGYDVPAELLATVEKKIALLSITRCPKKIENHMLSYNLSPDDISVSCQFIISADPTFDFSSTGKLKKQYYITDFHSPFYGVSKAMKQLQPIKRNALRIESDGTLKPVLRKDGAPKNKPATPRATEIKLFLLYRIMDMQGNYGGRKIALDSLYDDLRRFENRDNEYGAGDAQKIRKTINEILLSFVNDSVIKSFSFETGAHGKLTAITIVMPNDKPKKK